MRETKPVSDNFSGGWRLGGGGGGGVDDVAQRRSSRRRRVTVEQQRHDDDADERDDVIHHDWSTIAGILNRQTDRRVVARRPNRRRSKNNLSRRVSAESASTRPADRASRRFADFGSGDLHRSIISPPRRGCGARRRIYPVQSHSSMHRYECVALCKDISLQTGRFCARFLASWRFFVQVVRGRPGGRF